MPGDRSPTRRLWRAVASDPALLAFACAVVVAIAYLLLVPTAGTDLAAQVARAEAARRTGGSTWWGGWYGGISMPTYSVLSGDVMAVVGARLTGALAFVASCWLVGGLLRSTPRPRAGALAAVLALAGNLAVGRVTFALGLVLALLAIRLLESHQGGWAAGSAMGSSLLSPLAGLFLGMICVALAVTDPQRRRTSLRVAGASGAPILLTAILFPSSGIMPVSSGSIWLPMFGLAGVALFPLPRVVRLTAALGAGAVALAFLVPSPIGSNAQRLAVIACAPVVIALVRARAAALTLGVAALLIGPSSDIALSVQLAQDPSSEAAFYAPVIGMLPTELTRHGRLEVIETRGHWSSTYLADAAPLARGWERQTDSSNNPLFYAPTLDSESYHQWLWENAVSWVAVSDAQPDWGSRTEAALVSGNLPYLQEVWWTDHWRFFRVIDAAPVAATPATMVELNADSVQVTVERPGSTRVRVRWAPQFALSGPAGCVREAAGWTQLAVSLPGTYVLRGGFSPRKGLVSRGGPICTPGYIVS